MQEGKFRLKEEQGPIATRLISYRSKAHKDYTSDGINTEQTACLCHHTHPRLTGFEEMEEERVCRSKKMIQKEP